MKIIFDIVLSGNGGITATHYVDLDPLAQPSIVSPLDGKTMLNPLQAIALLQSNKAALLAAGWLEPTNVPGHPVGTTRWQILVAEANKATASPEVKALNLT